MFGISCCCLVCTEHFCSLVLCTGDSILYMNALIWNALFTFLIMIVWSSSSQSLINLRLIVLNWAKRPRCEAPHRLWILIPHFHVLAGLLVLLKAGSNELAVAVLAHFFVFVRVVFWNFWLLLLICLCIMLAFVVIMYYKLWYWLIWLTFLLFYIVTINISSLLLHRHHVLLHLLSASSTVLQ